MNLKCTVDQYSLPFNKQLNYTVKLLKVCFFQSDQLYPYRVISILRDVMSHKLSRY